MIQFNSVAILALVAVTMCWSLAVLLYRVGTAGSVAGAAMPNTKNTPEYAAFRKLQVYESSLSEAMIGGISKKERVLLNTLRDTLGISFVDATTLEEELQKGQTG